LPVLIFKERAIWEIKKDAVHYMRWNREMKPGTGKAKDFRYYYLAASISVLTFLVYLPALRNDFVGWDDSTYVTDNPHICAFDFAFLKWAFFDFYAANWHPLTWMSHALDYALWGLNPLGHHLTNNILHTLNTFLVVLLVAKLIEVTTPAPPYQGAELVDTKSSPPILGGVSAGRGGNRNEVLLPDKPPLPLLTQGGKLHGEFTIHDPRFTWVAAGVTGLLFGLHPLHVESVAWVAERKDLLCGLFFLLSVTMYMRYAGGGNPLWLPFFGRPQGAAPTRPYLLSLCFFILALMSKPMAVSLPVVLLILDWYPFQRITSLKTFRSSFIEKIPFIALSIASSIITMMAQKAGGAMELMDFLPFTVRFLVAVKSLPTYLWKMALPVNLLPSYPYPRHVSVVSFEYICSIFLVLGSLAACAVVARKQKLWLSVWFYYVVTLVPVLGIVQVGRQSMADRYVYLPSLGPFLVMSLSVPWVLKKLGARQMIGNASKRLFVVAVVVIIFMLGTLTIEQTGVWRNGLTLWGYVIGKDPDNASAHYYRGITLEEAGQFDKAAADYEKTLALNSRHYGAYNNRGVLYGKDGLFDKAIEQFNRSIEINPNYSMAYGNRGYTYFLLGQNDRAIDDFSKAIDLDYNYAKAYVNRGNLYLSSGRREYALSDFQKACALGDKEGCDAIHDGQF
jgi:protein O-mannosyl-transferase